MNTTQKLMSALLLAVLLIVPCHAQKVVDVEIKGELNKVAKVAHFVDDRARARS